MSGTEIDNSKSANGEQSTGKITVVYRAKVVLGGKVIDLGEFESEEEAEQAIMIAEVDWDQDLDDAKYPSKSRDCYNCDGSGQGKDDECNTCAGTGRIPV
ncbi:MULTISPECIES: hypothetical protein [Xanthomonas]|nr:MULTISPECIES: hypothetical protein [Xanthomonas]QTD87976.1 hypothetical protein XcfCFBP6988P_23340 [Xanthomonas citri pv. phaseoli var. fuscans]QTF14057.1 hypothetical protein XcfCFBP6989P_23255 [Xanthomonas citri pv. phaseoli var. fuscans]QTF14280.1 hypothetical protein XcfCFBP6991P_23985 [Xanthomonas citri pv. phaseoli var. fuscans]QTF76253.1 hypothetical protein XcfCFBP6990P_23285 [Xanthomonas citri pv. phaseoli var. fuscans]UZA99798.1 hypothetical protein OM946_00595 [Xanthomonas citri 